VRCPLIYTQLILIHDSTGPLLLRRMQEALVESVKHRAEFIAFDRTMRNERESEVKAWEKLLAEWEADPKATNPYLSKNKGEFLALSGR
jgi:hypothetical protein